MTIVIDGTNGITSTGTVAAPSTTANNAIISDTLSVGGATTLSNTLAVSSSTNLSSTLAVSGASTLNGSVIVTGGYNETANNMGVYVGTFVDTPRIGFFNGISSAQNWQIDNFNGAFRWYTPGVTWMQLSTTDGLQLNDLTSGYGEVPSEQTFRLVANGSAFGPGIGDFYGAASSIQLAASSMYEITYHAYFLKTTAGTATVTLTASSAPTSVVANYILTTGAASTPSTIQTRATAATVMATTASLGTGGYYAFQVKARVLTNAACNFRLRLTQSAGTATPQAGSYYTVKKISTTVGTYVA